jgi:hypothetical protein
LYLFSQPNLPIQNSIRKSVSLVSPVSTVSLRCAYNEDTALDTSPVRTTPTVAASQANVQKSTGLSAPEDQSKTWVALSALQNGDRGNLLQGILAGGEVLHGRFGAAMTATLGRGKRCEEERVDQVAAASVMPGTRLGALYKQSRNVL